MGLRAQPPRLDGGVDLGWGSGPKSSLETLACVSGLHFAFGSVGLVRRHSEMVQTG